MEGQGGLHSRRWGRCHREEGRGHRRARPRHLRRPWEGHRRRHHSHRHPRDPRHRIGARDAPHPRRQGQPVGHRLHRRSLVAGDSGTPGRDRWRCHWGGVRLAVFHARYAGHRHRDAARDRPLRRRRRGRAAPQSPEGCHLQTWLPGYLHRWWKGELDHRRRRRGERRGRLRVDGRRTPARSRRLGCREHRPGVLRSRSGR